MSISDDLNKAADILEHDGWCQGDFHNEEGAHCALGAINNAVVIGLRLNPDSFNRVIAAQCALANYLDDSGIAMWNDASDRTAKEVIQAMRDAAIKNQPDEFRSCPGGGGA